jgi:hypothetical protein
MIKVAITSIILAVLSMAGSCQTAALAATTTTAASQPVTFSILPVNPTAAAIYTTSPAPATVHVNLLNLLAHPTDWLTERDSWNFGDTSDPTVTDPRTAQPVHLSTQLQGPVAAYQYE